MNHVSAKHPPLEHIATFAGTVAEELERLKREVSLEELVRSSGVKLKRQGKDLLGLCPFHGDRNPSLVVSPKKNLWNCLGACQAGGSVVDWVMKAEQFLR